MINFKQTAWIVGVLALLIAVTYSVCPMLQFGLDCSYKCHCPLDDDCNKVNGSCPGGECHRAYFGEGCQKKLPRLLTAPQAEFFSCNNLTVTWKEFDASKDDGDGPVSHYLVSIKANTTDIVSAWTPIYTVYSRKRIGLSYTVIISRGLIPNVAYYVRVDTVSIDTNKEPLKKYMNGRELRDPVLNQCTFPCLVGTPCTIDTYCFEQADSSVLCSPCHEDCDLSLGCDGPLSENCRGCKPGFSKTPGFFPCLRASTCPVGTYGTECQNQCFCYNNDLCEQGKCTGGQCERGRTGLPMCLEFCPEQTFDLDCSLMCHCKDNEECNKVEGSCPSFQCHDDWDGLGCQRRLPKFSEPPKLLSSTCNNVTLGWSSFRENVDIGVGPIAQYNVMFKETDSDRWYNPLNFSNLEDTHYLAIINSGLTPDSMYQFRIDIMASEIDKLFVRRFVHGELTQEIFNNCSGYDFKTAAFGESISQKIQSRFLILLLLLLICILLLYIILENCKSKKHPPADVNVNFAEDAPDSKEPELPEELMIDNTEDLQTTEAEGENELEDEALPTFKRFSIFS
ncbi:multiple epidermal growth factor-like domains protein 11 isoform X4 [Biomphalaria glabrata]|uniref:Multiple epidermal growth factor-like domains protein 11 isoform X4 n=1 Tax=Biomphalaria glabrata TaxID=6526 RepID=A0A9W3AIH7_BIOGL|nr:multiple epidermal growth factor-like domains protein 11 isoform X4 [Biomphalaria glabrata]